MHKNAPNKRLLFGGICFQEFPFVLLLYGERYFIALGVNIDAVGLKH